MFTIKYADGNSINYSDPVSIKAVADKLHQDPQNPIIAGYVDGILVDTSYIIDHDVKLDLVTYNNPASLEIIRHSGAHLLAQAVKILFPSAQLAIGPVIDDGFYYDFAFERPFTEEDLQQIAIVMDELVKQDFIISRAVLGKAEAIALFTERNEPYKVEIISSIPDTETVSVYRQGDLLDLCRGPHLPSTGYLKAVKLTKVAGAYWRGDAKNASLQRIYGTAWHNEQDLTAYLTKLAEAQYRDHRKLGKQLDLFHFQEEAPGMVFWHAKGLHIYNSIKSYIRHQLDRVGYEEVVTPQLVDSSLWHQSGHWDMFADNMFVLPTENRDYVLKPMSCPCHVEIFKQKLRSYRDLPIRLAEFGCVHRNEATGSMHGLMRVRQMTQDDGHIFCTPEQIQSEALEFIKLVVAVYHDFGFDDVSVKLSTRPQKRIGDDALWDNAEHALAQALQAANLEYTIQAGEGAFYGPKIEFHLKDCCDRVWQCGTLQLDYAQPLRLNAHYINADSSKHTPVMLHRAILGSIERFIGILIEHYAGKLPLWLAPTQAILMNISDKQADYCLQLAQFFRNHGIRIMADTRNEKIGLKIREHTLQCIPYLLVVGDAEVANNTVSVRSTAEGNIGQLAHEEFLAYLRKHGLMHSERT